MVNIIFLLTLAVVLMLEVKFSVPGWIYIVVVVAYITIQTYGSFKLSAAFFLPVKYSGDRSGGGIALTFDDGPIAGNTERILNILKTHAVPAAFFCVGRRVTENPGILKRISDEGHIIANKIF
jgi:hypothetical protein